MLSYHYGSQDAWLGAATIDLRTYVKRSRKDIIITCYLTSRKHVLNYKITSFQGCISCSVLTLGNIKPSFTLTAMPRAFRMFILHMGHVRWSSSHGSTQLLWNKCLQRRKTIKYGEISRSAVDLKTLEKRCEERQTSQLLSLSAGTQESAQTCFLSHETWFVISYSASHSQSVVGSKQIVIVVTTKNTFPLITRKQSALSATQQLPSAHSGFVITWKQDGQQFHKRSTLPATITASIQQVSRRAEQ